MKVTVLSDAQVLVPNKEHQNFTRSNEVIKQGTVINGEEKIVKGLYRGNPFDYNLFYTDKGEIIYIKHIKPRTMQKTEVTLGADSGVSATKVEIPGHSNLGKRPIIGIIAGGLAGFGIAKWRKVEGKKQFIYVAIGAVAGFVIAKYIQSHRDIQIVKSK